jgi:hypothetical protein
MSFDVALIYPFTLRIATNSLMRQAMSAETLGERLVKLAGRKQLQPFLVSL